MNLASTRNLAGLLRRQAHTNAANINPWFVPRNILSQPGESSAAVESFESAEVPKLPEEAPSFVKNLHSVLCTSPFLEVTQLLVCKPLPYGDGPGLPRQRSHGTRRKRRQTYAGQGIEQDNSLWNWAVYAQVINLTNFFPPQKFMLRQIVGQRRN